MRSRSKEIRVGTPLHDKIVGELLSRWEMGRSKLDSAYTRYDNLEQRYDGFVSDVEANQQVRSRDSLEPEGSAPLYREIFIPYSYSVAWTYYTYISTVFLSRDPVFQLVALSPSMESSELAAESLHQWNLYQGLNRATLMNWINDGVKFGCGVMGTYWCEEEETNARIVTIPEEFRADFKNKKHVTLETTIGRPGHVAYYPVKLRDFVYDPRCSMVNFQKGEFCGEVSDISTFRLVEGFEAGYYIAENAQAIQDTPASTSLRNYSSTREEPEQNKGKQGTPKDDKFIFSREILEMHVRISPKAWGLGESTKMQLWAFGIVGRTLVFATPVDVPGQQFPFNLLPMDVDMHRSIMLSPIDRLAPFEDTINWLINTHFFNTRRHLTNSGVIDPSKVMLSDLNRRQPGGWIRARPSAFGQDPKTFLHQFQVGDVTKNHLSDVQLIHEYGQRSSGVSDNLLGMVNPGGRKTAQEIRATTSFSTNRLKALCEWLSATGFSQVLKQQHKTFQTRMDKAVMMRVFGDQAAGLQGAERFFRLTPEEIAGEFDFAPVDGSMPVDRMQQGAMMQQFIAPIMQNPQLAATYNIDGLMNYVARLMGARSLSAFKLQQGQQMQPPNVSMQPDQNIERQVQAGNMVPMKGLPQ